MINLEHYQYDQCWRTVPRSGMRSNHDAHAFQSLNGLRRFQAAAAIDATPNMIGSTPPIPFAPKTMRTRPTIAKLADHTTFAPLATPLASLSCLPIFRLKGSVALFLVFSFSPDSGQGRLGQLHSAK